MPSISFPKGYSSDDAGPDGVDDVAHIIIGDVWSGGQAHADWATVVSAFMYRRKQKDTTCSVYNGFGSLNTNKLANMVKFFLFKEGNVFPTKLNKEMFYADFAHYRKHGRSISGLRYKAIKYGPVPYHYDTIYDNIDGLEKNIVISHNSESTSLSCDGYDAKLFSTDELSTLESVFAITKDLTTEQIVKESHKEPAWTDYKSQNGFIPYSEAFNLVLL